MTGWLIGMTVGVASMTGWLIGMTVGVASMTKRGGQHDRVADWHDDRSVHGGGERERRKDRA